MKSMGNTSKKQAILTKLRNEKGALDLGSIMVGVVVLGILSAIVSATIFAVIPWSQDGAAKDQLNALVKAQETNAALKGGVYTADLGEVFNAAEAKITLYSDESTCYGAFIKSSSGKVFYTSSTQSAPGVINKPALEWPATKPTDYPADCVWPTAGALITGKPYVNLATNPSSETAAGYTVNARVNLHTNPSPYTAGAGAYYVGSSTGGDPVGSVMTGETPVGNTYYRTTTRGPAATWYRVNTNPAITAGTASTTFIPGAYYTFSVYGRVSLPKTVTAVVIWRRADGTTIEQKDSSGKGAIVAAANTWVRPYVTAAAPADVASAVVSFNVNGGSTAGTTADATGFLIEREFTTATDAASAVPGTYFDGVTANDSEFDYVWAGATKTAGQGYSVARGKVVAGAGISGTQGYAPYQTPNGGGSGQYATRFKLITGPTSRVGMNFTDAPGIQAGKGYTVIVKVKANRAITARVRLASGKESPLMPVPANTWTELKYYFPTGAAYDGATGLVLDTTSGFKGGDTIDVDGHAVVEGDFVGNYFDGDDGNAKWNGAPHASTSTGYFDE
jgi:hypothetical protein